MTADDSRAVPDTEAVREAEAWFRDGSLRLTCLDNATAIALDLRHAATIVRAWLARDVPTPTDEPRPLADLAVGDRAGDDEPHDLGPVTVADRAVASVARLAEAWAHLRMDTPEDQEAHDELVAESRRTAAAYMRERKSAARPAGDDTAPAADEVLLVQLDGRKGGQVTVGHSRLPVTTVLRALGRDGTVASARAAYPDLTEEQGRVLAVLRRELAVDTAAPDDSTPTELDRLRAKLAETRASRDDLAEEREYLWEKLTRRHSELAETRAAGDAVLALHKPIDGGPPDSPIKLCGHCINGVEELYEYPCPTVQAWRSVRGDARPGGGER